MCAPLYETYDELLEREDLDIVSCTTENARHAEVVEAAAARGLHVLVEKPMAASLAQAERMVAAASFAGVKLFLNWPSSWQPPLQHAIKLAREGFIGQVYEARYRGGHTGPRDLGCSPYFYSWLYDAELNGGGASAELPRLRYRLRLRRAGYAVGGRGSGGTIGPGLHYRGR